MNLLNGLLEVRHMVVYPSNSELFGKVAEVVKANEIDLGEFEEQFDSIAEKIEDDIAAQEEPVTLYERDQEFIYGLALILGIR